MFGTRISFPFSRIFRLRKRRAAEESASSANVERVSCPAPPPPSKSVSSQLKPVKTTPTPSARRPRSLFITSVLNPIAQSPISPDVSSVPGPPPTILIIGRDPPQSTHFVPLAPTPPGNVGPRSQVDGVSLLESPPVPNTRRVSFQLPITDRPVSTLSACSTLVSSEVGTQAEAEIAPEVPPEQPPAPEALDSGSVGVASAEPIADLPGAVRSGSGKSRPISLFNPQPVRADVSRFSLPVSPAVPTKGASANARDGRRDSRRTSSIPPSCSASTKKEKRTSRWSREINKPETQEVLRVLRGL